MSGSKPGERRGGRKRGTKNKSTMVRERNLAASGEMPVDYMLRVMRDKQQEHSRRDEMAKAVAPYVHPKLAALNAKIEGEINLEAILVQSIVGK